MYVCEQDNEQYVKFLQIWMFPNKQNVEPRYDQITLDKEKLQNNLYQILSPNPEDDGVWVHQDAWFRIGELEKGYETTYKVKQKGNGVYAFIIYGKALIAGELLDKKDGIGIYDANQLTIKAENNSKILLMEVPLEI